MFSPKTRNYLLSIVLNTPIRIRNTTIAMVFEYFYSSCKFHTCIYFIYFQEFTVNND